jgi:transposase
MSYNGLMPRPTGSQKELEKRRLRAADLFEEGKLSQVEIAQQLGVSLRTIYRWQGAIRQKGRKGLKSTRVKGRPGKLTRDALVNLGIWLRGNRGKIESSLMRRELQRRIETEFSVKYHSGHIGRLIKRIYRAIKKVFKDPRSHKRKDTSLETHAEMDRRYRQSRERGGDSTDPYDNTYDTQHPRNMRRRDSTF